MKSLVIDDDFIQSTAKSIISLIIPNENYDFYHGVIEYEQNEGEFPGYIDDFITEKLINISKTNKQVNKILHDYQKIINVSKYYQLYNSIFYSNNTDGFVEIGGDTDDDDDDLDEASENNNNNDSNVDDVKQQINKKQPVMTLKELGLIQDGIIAQISELFSIHIEIAEILLKLFNFKDDEDNGAILYSLPCGHLFCKNCIKRVS